MAHDDAAQSVTQDDYLSPPTGVVRRAVEIALAEDLNPLGDLTAVLLPADAMCTARFISRQHGVIAGTSCAEEAFRQVDPSIEVTWRVRDGEVVEPRTEIGCRCGTPARPFLACDRSLKRRFGPAAGATIEATSPTPSWSRTITSPAWASPRPCTPPGRIGRIGSSRSNASAWNRWSRRSKPAPILCCWTTCRQMRFGLASTGVDLISVGALTNSAPVLDIGLDI